MWLQREISLRPPGRGFHLVTRDVVGELPELGELKIGLLHLFMLHTSASLTLNENASPDVRRDFESWFNDAVPEDAPYWTHTVEGPDDMPAHIKASLLGPSLSLPVSPTAGSRSAPGRGSTSASTATGRAAAACSRRSGARARDTHFVDGVRSFSAPPDRVALLRERGRALARVLGAEDRPGDLALALPASSALQRGASTRMRLEASSASGPLAAIAAASSSAPATASPGSASRFTTPTRAPRSAEIGSPVSASSIARCTACGAAAAAARRRRRRASA